MHNVFPESADLPKAWTKREYLVTLPRKEAASLHHMGLDKARNEAFEVLNCLQFANYTTLSR